PRRPYGHRGGGAHRGRLDHHARYPDGAGELRGRADPSDPESDHASDGGGSPRVGSPPCGGSGGGGGALGESGGVIVISHFFIDRPIFATVLSLVILIIGGVALVQLPIAQYPEVAPPTVQVTPTHPGAN